MPDRTDGRFTAVSGTRGERDVDYACTVVSKEQRSTIPFGLTLASFIHGFGSFGTQALFCRSMTKVHTYELWGEWLRIVDISRPFSILPFVKTSPQMLHRLRYRLVHSHAERGQTHRPVHQLTVYQWEGM